MNKPFGTWLSEKLDELKMIPADVTRATGLDSGVLSNIINNRRMPSVDTCKALAKAMNIPLEEVYRAADILPQKPSVDAISEAVLHIVLSLPTEDRKDILEYARLRHKLATEKGNIPSASKGTSKRTATA
jgi:transcriptional regulator with XRE-family HTH domain